jgi:ATP-dependent helicase/nuclease subunit B
MTGASGPNLYTIPAGQPFVDLLAATILDDSGGDPAKLSSWRILLPTRRACRSLRDAFLRLGGGKAMLLPRMTPLGDLDEDEALFSDAGGLGGATELAHLPAIPDIRRILMLSKLIRSFQEGTRDEASSPAQSVELARELAHLLDESQTERLDFGDLAGLAPEIFADHWQQTLKFLEIVTTLWPSVLEGEGMIDGTIRRNAVIEAQTEAWAASPPPYPVVAAGSTGSLPATADLLKVIAGLPEGRVVLPGFDREMVAEVARAVGETHPQYGMLKLVDHLGVAPDRVMLWPGAATESPEMDRRRLIVETLRPADTTERWRDLDPPRDDALDGLRLIECATPQEESGIIALLMREAMTEPRRTAALVTPDRALARRVSSLLLRWDLEVDDSAGQPLSTTPAGSFALLLAEAADDGFSPVALLSLLKHPLAALGMAPETFRNRLRWLEEKLLRGPAPEKGTAGLRKALAGLDGEYRTRAADILNDIIPLLEPFEQALAGGTDAASLLTAHINCIESLADTDTERGADRIWRGDDGEALSGFFEKLQEAADDFPAIGERDWSELLTVLLAGATVRRRFGAHPRLSILSPMEARLQQFDLVILGGLNEQAWPPADRVDPWMSRDMRRRFGLPTADRRVGLAAHDFAQMSSQPEVVLTRALRADGAPTVASRWIVRLQNLLDGFGLKDDLSADQANYRAWHRFLDACPNPKSVSHPRPVPPVEARPTGLSVTRVETWLRDPYAIYAERILRLKALDALEEQAGAAEKGTAIHQALETFCLDYPDDLPADAVERLIAIGNAKFDELGVRPAVLAFWRPRFERIAEWFVTLERERRLEIARSLFEVKGMMTIAGPLGDFRLTCEADRIDILKDGSAVLVDYKTGTPPKRNEVEAGFAPQLPLEAAIAQAGGFDGLEATAIARLEYWKLSGSREAGKVEAVADGNGVDLGNEALEGLRNQIEIFSKPETAYLSRPRPERAPRYSDYEHLARVLEWSVADGGGDE